MMRPWCGAGGKDAQNRVLCQPLTNVSRGWSDRIGPKCAPARSGLAPTRRAGAVDGLTYVIGIANVTKRKVAARDPGTFSGGVR